MHPRLVPSFLPLFSLGLASAQATIVPSDVQMPGTQPGEVPALEAPAKCDNCHAGYDPSVEPTHLWRGGMMAQAGRDPLFWATLAVAEQDFAGAGDLCLRCHAAEGWLAGRSTPTDGSGLAVTDGSGVSCDLCHALVDPDGSEHPGVQLAPYLAHDEGTPPVAYRGSGMMVLSASGAKLGPYADPASPHQALPSAFHRSSAFCGTCHDVSNPVVGDLAPANGAQEPLPPGVASGVPGAPVAEKAAFNAFPYRYGVVERTYSEHVASAFPTTAVGSFPSLPPELRRGAIARAWDAARVLPGADYADGTPRTFTCQSCHMRPGQGKGCNKNNAPLRSDLPLHDQTGANLWVPEAIRWLDQRGALILGGGLSAAEELALQDGQERALESLRSAAALDVDGDTVRVVNLTGHKLISGYPEGRRLWLHVRWLDARGRLVREDGAYGLLDVSLAGEPMQVASLLDLDDPHLRAYEAHPGITSKWAATLVSLGYPSGLALSYDRLTGAVTKTLGELAAEPPGSAHETFHFALNDRMLADRRIPPWGMRHDEARARSILPVPETLYGDPGPGGTYRHWDEVALDPPREAARGSLRLLYQTTSWEYVQFLRLANDGSVASLASTGDDLLEAWLQTAMAPPVVVASASWRRRAEPAPAPSVAPGP